MESLRAWLMLETIEFMHHEFAWFHNFVRCNSSTSVHKPGEVDSGPRVLSFRKESTSSHMTSPMLVQEKALGEERVAVFIFVNFRRNNPRSV